MSAGARVDPTKSLALAASVLTGAMFVYSGTMKARSRSDWERQSRDLDVDPRVASIVPGYELALGAAVLSGVARPWPARLAVGTLGVFTWFLARRLLDGTRPPCACFGSASTKPLGRRHIARNAVLMGVATVAALR